MDVRMVVCTVYSRTCKAIRLHKAQIH